MEFQVQSLFLRGGLTGGIFIGAGDIKGDGQQDAITGPAATAAGRYACSAARCPAGLTGAFAKL
jgi:hypothetical protein